MSHMATGPTQQTHLGAYSVSVPRLLAGFRERNLEKWMRKRERGEERGKEKDAEGKEKGMGRANKRA